MLKYYSKVFLMISAPTSLLILEDQPEICNLIKLSLFNQFSHIDTAHTVAEASLLHSNHQFSVAIIDSCLPDGDPYPLVKDLMQQGCKIILISGNFELNQSLAELPFPKIEKPFRIKTLINTIESSLSA